MTLVAEQTDKQCFSNRWTSLRLPDALEDRRVAYKENLGHPPAIYPPTLTSMSLFSKNVPLVSQAELTKCSGSSEGFECHINRGSLSVRKEIQRPTAWF